MRFSFASTFAFGALFLGAFAAPTGEVLNGVSGLTSGQTSQLTQTSSYEKTTTVTKNETVYSVVNTLYSNVQQHTGSINKTCSGVPEKPSQQDKQTALISIKADIKSIASLIVDASIKVGKLEVNADVNVSVIVDLVVKLVFEIVATLQVIVATLGGTITVLLGSVLTLLVHAISALLLALQDILGDVIATVWSIVSGLLPFVGDVLIGLGDVLKGDCGCLAL